MNKNVTAVIADDVFEMRTLLSKSLKVLACEVLATANDGPSALVEVKKVKPDMVFLDIDMPGLTGLQVLDKLKSENIDVFKVIVSGSNTVENVKEAIAHGANGFVVKPYSISKIKQIMDKYHASIGS